MPWAMSSDRVGSGCCDDREVDAGERRLGLVVVVAGCPLRRRAGKVRVVRGGRRATGLRRVGGLGTLGGVGGARRARAIGGFGRSGGARAVSQCRPALSIRPCAVNPCVRPWRDPVNDGSPPRKGFTSAPSLGPLLSSRPRRPTCMSCRFPRQATARRMRGVPGRCPPCLPGTPRTLCSGLLYAGPVKVLVIGTGAREHAIVKALGADPEVDAVIAAPGNPGMDSIALCEPLPGGLLDGEGIAALARRARRRPRRGGSGGPARRGSGGRGARGGHPLFRAVGRGCPARGEQGVRQGRHGSG